MNRIHVTGWRYGFDKIAMTKTIRAHLGLGLAAAKACTDRVLEGGQLTLEAPDAHTAHALAVELDALGADVTSELESSPSHAA